MREIIVYFCDKIFWAIPYVKYTTGFDCMYYNEILHVAISPADNLLPAPPKWYKPWMWKIQYKFAHKIFNYIKENSDCIYDKYISIEPGGSIDNSITIEGKKYIVRQEYLSQKQKMNCSIVIDYKVFLDNPMKVLIEDVLGLIEIKSGFLPTFNPNSSPVKVSSFYITRTPITIDLWKILMNDNDRLSYSRRVEWDDYHLLLNKLKEITKVDFSFPSSIQWEYATRASDCVKMPSYDNRQRYCSYIAVGLWNLYKREWCPPKNEKLPYQLLCSMGNGHEELFLFLATKNDLSTLNYTKEEKNNLSLIISKIPNIQIINKPL